MKRKLLLVLMVVAMLVCSASLFACGGTPAKYTVTFKAEGEVVATQTVEDGKTATKPANPTRTGYTFNGWDFDFTTAIKADTTIDATWLANRYVVKFDKNGGEGTMADQTFTYDSSQALSTNVYTKAGYVFAGWKNGNDTYTDGQMVKNLTAENNGEVILQAQWEASQYTIKFDKNGGVGAMNDQVFEVGKNQNLSFNVFTKEGYTFDGWACDGKTYTDGEAVLDVATAGQTVTLVAQWKANTFTVKFDKGFFSSAEGTMQDQTFAYGTAQKLTANAYNVPGYVFEGWAYGGKTYANEEEVMNLTATNDGKAVLVAQWRASEYTVKFEANCETYSGQMPIQTFKYDEAKNLRACAFNRAGYIFAGWKMQGDQSDKIYANATEVVNLTNVDGAELVFLAQWEVNTYIVKFDKGADNVTGLMVDTTFTCGVAKNLPVNTFERVGYTFAGWMLEETVYEDGQSVQDVAGRGEEVTLVAQWAPITYTINFDKGNVLATGVMANQVFAYDVAQSVNANEFVYQGYTFTGWKSVGVDYADQAEINNLTEVNGTTFTFVAQWEANTFTVKFDKNGDDVTGEEMANQEFIYDAQQALTLNAFSKTGYTFAGWAYNNNVYTDGAIVKNLTTENEQEITLVAQWEANTYTIKFEKGNVAATGEMANQEFTYGVAQNLTANEFELAGFEFDGWKLGEIVYTDAQEVNSLTAINGAEITLVAQWRAVGYTIKFVAGNESATGDVANVTFFTGESKPLSKNAFVLPGYTFAGWTYGGKTYQDQEVVNIEAIEGTGVEFTFTAIWEANAYTVKYVAGATTGVAGEMSDTAATYDVYFNLAENGFTRDGYTFAGWKDASGVEYTQNQQVKNLTAENGAQVILTAQWTANKYTIKFVAGEGGQGEAMADQEFTYDVAQALSANTYTNSDSSLKFGGWTYNGEVYGDKEEVINLATSGSITLTARWVGNTFSVTYASGATDATGTVAGEEINLDAQDGKVVKENGFVRTGYTFAGWTFAGSDYAPGDAVTVFNAQVGDVITLTAKWTANKYTVKFDKNSDLATGEMADQEFTYGEAQNLTAIGFDNGEYAFIGWKLGEQTFQNEQEVINLTAENGAVITLVAEWKANAITFKFNAGNSAATGVMADQKISVAEDVFLNANGFELVGYEFVYWVDAEGNEYLDEEDVIGTYPELFEEDGKVVVLTAVWEPITYTIRFANGGEGVTGGPMADMTFAYGESKPLTENTLVKTGYIFAGWEYNSNTYLDKAVISNFTTENKAEFTFTAKWTAIKYTVEFNKNSDNATGEMANQEFTYGVAQNLTENKFEVVGYEFDGWKDSVSGTIYQDAQEVINLTTTNNAKIILLAQWKIVETTITFANTDGYTITAQTKDGADFVSGSKVTINDTLVFTVEVIPGYKGGELKADGTKLTINAFEVSSIYQGGTVAITAEVAPITYTVKFDKGADAAQGEMLDQVFTYGETKALTEATFTYKDETDYYVLVGWAYQGTYFTNGQEVSNLTTNDGEIVTLVARWESTKTAVKLNGWRDKTLIYANGQNVELMTSVEDTLGNAYPVTAEVKRSGASYTITNNAFTYTSGYVWTIDYSVTINEFDIRTMKVTLAEQDTVAPAYNDFSMGLVELGENTLPEIVVLDNVDEEVSPTFTIYKKDTSETIAIVDGKFTIPAYGTYVIKIEATDKAGNKLLAEHEFIARQDAPLTTLENFESEDTLINALFDDADKAWHNEFQGKQGVVEIKPSVADPDYGFAYFNFKTMRNALDYKDITINAIAVRMYIDSNDENGIDTFKFQSQSDADYQGVGANAWIDLILTDANEYINQFMNGWETQLFWGYPSGKTVYIDGIYAVSYAESEPNVLESFTDETDKYGIVDYYEDGSGVGVTNWYDSITDVAENQQTRTGVIGLSDLGGWYQQDPNNQWPYGYRFKLKSMTAEEFKQVTWDYIKIDIYIPSSSLHESQGGWCSLMYGKDVCGENYPYWTENGVESSFYLDSWSELYITKDLFENEAAINTFIDKLFGEGAHLFQIYMCTGELYIDSISYGTFEQN